ncbi:MAG TPA: outer membrane lipoprotein carrier protein LolA [Candidatus Limnocylindrales bacterium]|nr:outer membrane lipoprotein carrier protein LolA [Candidatus Limnocylindrales bacterium]
MRRLEAALFGLWITVTCAVLLLCAGLTAYARPAWTLGAVLHEMDQTAKDFHSLSADVERTKVTVVVNDRSTETGTIRVRGDKMLLEMNAPDARTVLRTGDNLYLYNPGLHRVEEYDLGKNRGMVDQFLLLGFGTRGKELEKAYDIKLAGEPTVDGKKTIELELTPKSDAVRKQISKVEIWIDPENWLPVEQQFYETGSGDYSIVKYSRVVKNSNIPESAFKPHWPKGTEKIKPQV